jgi:hypothetical protein
MAFDLIGAVGYAWLIRRLFSNTPKRSAANAVAAAPAAAAAATAGAGDLDGKAA